MIRRFDPSWVYYQHLSELIDLDIVSEAELRVVADAMYGSGRGAISTVLSRTRSHVTDIRHFMNPGFGGIHPEPIARYLTELAAQVTSLHAHVGIATDGDADRIGAVDNEGRFVDPHTILALVLRHLVEHRHLSGDVVKTVSTTFMIDEMATRYGLDVVETPVGFNHIADLMLTRDVLIGGEESGGISIKGHIPEGDGILMGLLLLEVMAKARAPLSEIITDLQAQFGPAFYERVDQSINRVVNKDAMVARLSQDAPGHLIGQPVRSVSTLDGVKYYLDDHSWLLIRPSGTEPVLRTYAEARSPEAVKALLAEGLALAQSVIPAR
jgi:phosphomannomutase